MDTTATPSSDGTNSATVSNNGKATADVSSSIATTAPQRTYTDLFVALFVDTFGQETDAVTGITTANPT